MLAMTGRGRRLRGLTLIETLVTIALAVLLLTLAAPGMTAYGRSSELTAAANRLLAAVNATRGEAMKRGMTAMLVPAHGGADWNAGWVIFMDADGKHLPDAGGHGLVATAGPLPSYVSLKGNGVASGSTPYVMFNASGFSRTKSGAFGALALTLVRTDGADGNPVANTRKIIISSTGRARVCRPASATDTDCSDASTW